MSIVISTAPSLPSSAIGDLESPNHTVSEQSTHPANDAARPISWWWLAVPLLLFALAMVSLRSNPAASSAQDSPAIGKAAPRIDLVRLTDESVLDRLETIPQGKVTLLHFWGTWCGPCKMEYPQLSTLASRLQSSPQFRFLPVSCEGGQGETFDGLWRKTYEYFASEEIDSFAFADPRGITRRSAAERLERSSMFYPTSILVGVDGRIVGVWEGYTPDSVEQMEIMISRLVKGSVGEI